VGEIGLVAIVGAGQEACALARVAALAGFSVRLFDPDAGALDAAQARIRDAVAAGVVAGALTADDQQRTLDGILATSDLDEATTHADLVVEATEGTAEARRALVMRIGDACRASALVATCGGDPDELMDYLPQPGRLVALRLSHGGVAIEGGVETSAHALAAAERFAARLDAGARAVAGRAPPR
jgi:3-hydroxyacyl-CoA dehydrogenase